MGKISFDVNNGGKLNVCQVKHDGSIYANFLFRLPIKSSSK